MGELDETLPDAAGPDDPASRAARAWIWLLVVAAVVIFPLLFPAHTPFINDEPQLIDRALSFNAKGQLADSGLVGTKGRRYGPLPVWIYQGMLLITHDPVALMTMHIALLTLAMVLSLGWLGRTLRLWRWGLPALAMSPYAWFYARQMWDNSFNLPLSIAILAAYAAFLARPRTWMLMLTAALAVLMLLVHLMAAPLIAAILVHLVLFRRKDLSGHWQLALVAAALTALLAVKYWARLFEYDPTFVRISSEPNGWWFALLGPRVLSGAWIDYLFPQSWLASPGGAVPWVVLILQLLSMLAFPLTWFGMAIGIRALARRRRVERSAAEEIAIVCVLVVLGQLLLNGLTHTFGHPHYYNGTWGVYAALMWIGLDRIAKWNWGRVVGWAQTAAVSGLCVLLLIKVVNQHGTRDLRFGATLGNQLQVLRDWSKYDDGSTIDVQVLIVPMSLKTLKTLRPPQRTGTEPPATLVIRYASDDPDDGRIEIVPR